MPILQGGHSLGKILAPIVSTSLVTELNIAYFAKQNKHGLSKELNLLESEVCQKWNLSPCHLKEQLTNVKNQGWMKIHQALQGKHNSEGATSTSWK